MIFGCSVPEEDEQENDDDDPDNGIVVEQVAEAAHDKPPCHPALIGTVRTSGISGHTRRPIS